MQYEIKKKDIVLDLEVITNEVSLKGNVTFENVKETKDKATADYKVSLQVKEDGETYKIALQGDLTVEKGNIEVVSTDDSVYYEDLSKNDLKELQKNLQDILKKFNLEDWLAV